MPGLDGTGPQGMGPMTGGGRGLCGRPGMRSAWRPYGARRWAAYAYPTREQELDDLKDEAGALRRSMAEVEARIKELSAEG